jgi:hypothetical protein
LSPAKFWDVVAECSTCPHFPVTRVERLATPNVIQAPLTRG